MAADRYVSLGPMVRLSTLPLRLLSIERGANLVYTEEIPAAKLARCLCRYDDRLQTYDWILEPCSKQRSGIQVERMNKSNNVVLSPRILRTCRAEAGRFEACYAVLPFNWYP
jgi:tRNA-dihydrouridine synthase